MATTKKNRDLVKEINGLSVEINNILNEKRSERYFEGIAILYSFIEDILKWLAFTQIVWNKSSEGGSTRPTEEIEQVRNYCNQQNLSSLLSLGLSIDLLSYRLYKRLDDIRIERNTMVHQYWLYIHKGRRLIFRKKLEKLAGAASALVDRFNQLVEETGMDESYGFFEVAPSRNFVTI
jgi:hypothetical protein